MLSFTGMEDGFEPYQTYDVHISHSDSSRNLGLHGRSFGTGTGSVKLLTTNVSNLFAIDCLCDRYGCES